MSGWQVATGSERAARIGRNGTLYVGRRHAGRQVRFVVHASDRVFRVEPCDAGDVGARRVSTAGLVSAGPVIAALGLPRGEEVALTVDGWADGWPSYRVAENLGNP